MVSSSDRLRVPFLPSFFSNLTRFTEFYRVYRVLLSFFLPNIGLVSDSSPTSFFLPSFTESNRTRQDSFTGVVFRPSPHHVRDENKTLANVAIEINGGHCRPPARVQSRRCAASLGSAFASAIDWLKRRARVSIPAATKRSFSTPNDSWSHQLQRVGGRPSPGTGTRLGPFLERPMGWRRGGG